MESGVVHSVNSGRGFLFVRPDSGAPDVFAFYKTLQGGLVLTDALKGQRVRFTAEHSEKGPRAIEVLPE